MGNCGVARLRTPRGEARPLAASEGVDAEALLQWQNTAKIPTVYDPPQLKSRGGLMDCTLCVLRSSCGGTAQVARCCCYKCCCYRQYGRITEPDEWFMAMLTTDVSPNCPKFLHGLWWLYDNPADKLITFHDADWVSQKKGLKNIMYNWTVDANSIFSTILTGSYWVRGSRLALEISPNGKWIHAWTLSGSNNWIYVIQPGDKLHRPDGTPVEVIPGEDLLRVSYLGGKQELGLSFQYLVRRVAYLDWRGRLVKTRYYDEMREAARATEARCCPTGGAKGLGDYLQDEQAFTLPPPPKQQGMAAE